LLSFSFLVFLQFSYKMSLSKPGDNARRSSGDNDEGCKAALSKALQLYSSLLQRKPVLTKACTSACTGALGNLLSQYLTIRSSSGIKKRVDWYSVACYAVTGFVLVGPAMHHYYRLVEKLLPTTVSYCRVKRLLVDRLLYTPAFLFVYLYLLCILEGCGPQLARKKIEAIYWTLYRANLKVLTLLQFINLSYVPHQFRVLFGNLVAIFWSCYIASKRAS